MPPNQAIRADKSIRCSLLAAVGPLIILSWPEAINASHSMRACRMAIRRNDFLCLLSLISRNSPKQLGMVSPELPRYGVPGTTAWCPLNYRHGVPGTTAINTHGSRRDRVARSYLVAA